MNESHGGDPITVSRGASINELLDCRWCNRKWVSPSAAYFIPESRTLLEAVIHQDIRRPGEATDPFRQFRRYLSLAVHDRSYVVKHFRAHDHASLSVWGKAFGMPETLKNYVVDGADLIANGASAMVDVLEPRAPIDLLAAAAETLHG